MNVKCENVEKNVVKLELEVAPEVFEEGLQYSFKKNAHRFQVKGFRAGKAPRKIVEQVYGQEVLYEDALNKVLPGEYYKAVEELGIAPVDDPEYDIVELDKEKLIFTAKVTVKPEVKLGEYKGLEIKLVSDEVTDADVEEELNRVAERNSRMVNVEDRPAQLGDTLDIDFSGYLDGEPFDGGSAQGHQLTLGSGQFIPGFEDQLVGAEVGGEVTVSVTFPEDYQAENLAGKPVEFKVTVNDIKKKELPVIDDEFASDVSEFETLEEYRNSIREKLAEQKKKNAKSAMENEVVEKASANAEVDIPDCMVERQIQAKLQEYDRTLRMQRGSLEQYLTMIGQSMEQFQDQMRGGIEKGLRESLVLEAISKAEDIPVEESQIDEEIDQYAKQYRSDDVDGFKATVTEEDRRRIGENLKINNTVTFLLDQAVKK